MSDAESDLPSAISAEAEVPVEDAEDAERQTESRPNQAGPGWFIPLSALWWNLLCAAIAAPLAFVAFALALIWDQWLWMAVVALPIGIAAAIYATWCLMMLQRFYLEQRTSGANVPG